MDLLLPGHFVSCNCPSFANPSQPGQDWGPAPVIFHGDALGLDDDVLIVAPTHSDAAPKNGAISFAGHFTGHIVHKSKRRLVGTKNFYALPVYRDFFPYGLESTGELNTGFLYPLVDKLKSGEALISLHALETIRGRVALRPIHKNMTPRFMHLDGAISQPNPPVAQPAGQAPALTR